MADPEDRVMRTYWPPSLPVALLTRLPSATRRELARFTGPDAARDLVDAVFASRPFFFVDQQR